jgi:hypothetical protein
MSAPLATPTKARKANLTCRQSTMGRKPEPAAQVQIDGRYLGMHNAAQFTGETNWLKERETDWNSRSLSRTSPSGGTGGARRRKAPLESVIYLEGDREFESPFLLRRVRTTVSVQSSSYCGGVCQISSPSFGLPKGPSITNRTAPSLARHPLSSGPNHRLLENNKDQEDKSVPSWPCHDQI